jgi:hypothetical protein
MSLLQLCGYTKLMASLPEGCSQYYALNRKLKLLRVLIFAKDDPFHERTKTTEQIYSITRGKNRYDQFPENDRLIAAMKKEV